MDEPRTVLITGGRGIGAAIARRFHGGGDHVLIGSRTDSGLAAELGERARFHTLDVRDQSSQAEFVAAAAAWTGHVDVFVNNAGRSGWRPLGEIDESFLEEMLATNLKGAFWGCKAAAARMKDGGCIVNVSSLAGKRGSANNAAYCAAKFGLNGLTQALAKELGPAGIRVNAVCPVYVETEGLTDALNEVESPTGGADIHEYLADFARDNAALRRLPRAHEVADLCWYLASSEATAVTGQCINVDCGVLPQ